MERRLSNGLTVGVLPRSEGLPKVNYVLYGDHPYGNTLPTEASITGTDIAALRAAHAARFRPDQALLVMAGRVTADEALALAQSVFGDWSGAGPALPALPPQGRQSPPQFVLVPRAEACSRRYSSGDRHSPRASSAPWQRRSPAPSWAAGSTAG